MKKLTLVLLCLLLAAFAMDRTGSTESANYHSKGTYTVVESFAVGLATSYGMAIKDGTSNSLWISNWGTKENIEFNMATGTATGTTWAITDSIDADDQAFCQYGSGDQFFFGDWVTPNVGVFDASGTFVKTVASPFGKVTGVAAGHDMLYVSDFDGSEIAYGSYTGTEATVTWTNVDLGIAVYGMAAHGDYLFVCINKSGEDNIFVYDINSDGSVGTTPTWSCEFTEELPSGGIDYDGTNLWVYPQNKNLFKLTIDLAGSNIEETTWGQIKSL